MGIMDLVRKISEKKHEKSKKFKEMQEDDRLNTMLEERKKSANLRELEKFYKDQEEAKIKLELDKIHKQQNSEMWKSKHGVLDKGISITRNDRPILKEKNIFMDKKNNIPFVKGEQMFFKR